MSKIEQQTFYVRDKPDTKCHPDTSCAKHNKTWMKLKFRIAQTNKNSLSKQQFKFLTIQIDFEWHRCLCSIGSTLAFTYDSCGKYTSIL